MREVDLRKLDLNLLVILEALLEERSVTRAAERLGMSQPAVSRALARLRAMFSDAVLVEVRQGYVLSARAERMQPVLRRLLAGVGDLLDARPFDPAGATGQVRLMMPDFQAGVLAPRLLARITAEAPALNLDIMQPDAALLEALEKDAVDAIVGVIDDAPAGIRRRGLYDDGFVTLMRVGHPAAEGTLTLERYLELAHIVISVTGVGPAPMDEALARMGRTRRIGVRVPSFLAAVEIAARSDLVMTLPASLAQAAAGMARFVVLPPPVDLGSFTMSLVWHERHQDEPRHMWLRGVVVDAAKEIAGRGGGAEKPIRRAPAGLSVRARD